MVEPDSLRSFCEFLDHPSVNDCDLLYGSAPVSFIVQSPRCSVNIAKHHLEPIQAPILSRSLTEETSSSTSFLNVRFVPHPASTGIFQAVRARTWVLHEECI